MVDFNRPFENNYPGPEDDKVNIWVKIIAIAGVIGAAVLVYMDVLDKVSSWR